MLLRTVEEKFKKSIEERILKKKLTKKRLQEDNLYSQAYL